MVVNLPVQTNSHKYVHFALRIILKVSEPTVYLTSQTSMSASVYALQIE